MAPLPLFTAMRDSSPAQPEAPSAVVVVETPTAAEETGSSTSSGYGLPQACKSHMMTWKLLGAALAVLVVMGWVFIIVMLILEEKWQLVLVAWLLLYSAAHFCYWYCKRHSLVSIHRQIRLRVLSHLGGGEGKTEDGPPTYDEVMDAEAPPPAYFTVISETEKPVPAPAPSPAPAHTQEAPSVPDSPPPYVASVSGTVAAGGAKEYLQCPPAYHTPRHLRKISPRILPTVHEARARTDTAVTATAMATAAATVAAAVTGPTTECEEDPIRGPIVRQLRATTMATLDVTSEEQSSAAAIGDATSDHDDEEAATDLQAPVVSAFL